MSYKKRLRYEWKIERENHFDYSPKVVLAYVTCDDFIPESLLASMHQSYQNTVTYILDDSRNEEYKKQVDQFAKEHHVKVIRRDDHVGFKAGNLNHFLKKYTDWEFAVILDSDEVIPYRFVEKSLSFFKFDSKLGILQCTHVSTRNYNRFMQIFYRGVNAHWPTYQTMKETSGVLSLLGHGAMIRKECFDDAKGFPEVVAEDISFTMEANHTGWNTRFALTIKCEEQFPVDYLAFKKRMVKWTGGNMEFIQHYTKLVFSKGMFRWYEKLDMLLFVYSLPLTYLFSFFMILNLIIMPVRGVLPGYRLISLIPTVICFFSPSWNDMLYNYNSKNFGIFKQISYSLHSFILYGSMYFTSLSSSLLYFLGRKPRFIVTPKKDRKYSFWQSIIYNKNDLIFAIILLAISFVFNNSFAPVALIILPILFEPYLTLLSGRK